MSVKQPEPRVRQGAVMKPLGENQLACLRSLVEHAGYPGTGWLWDNHSGTVRILESLVKRGLATKAVRQNGKHTSSVYVFYTATDAGREAAKYEYQRLIEELKK